jgi:hypothetical protein
MNCPKCGTQNAETSRFCMKCGTKLEPENVPQNVYYPAQPQRPAYVPPVRAAAPGLQLNPVTIGAGAAIIAGGLIILGWLTPWFSMGSLGNSLLNYLGIGSAGLFKLGGGVGNGLQITLLAIGAAFLAFQSSDFFLVGLLLLVLAGFFVAIPVMAGLAIRNGIRIFEISPYGKPIPTGQMLAINGMVDNTRKKMLRIIIMMVVLFVLLSIIPYGTAFLGTGFYLVLLGAIAGFAGSLYVAGLIKTIWRG